MPRSFLKLDALEVRLAPSAGQLDPNFGTGGVVNTTITATQEDGSRTVAVDSQNRIVVGGHYFTGSHWDFALTRYLPSGAPDTSFDGDGIVTTSFGTGNDFLFAVAFDSQDRIVVGGRANIGGVNRFALARYNVNGSLDNTFGSGGKVTTAIGSVDDSISDIVIDPNDRIVVAGQSHNGTKFLFAVARYEVNGSLDLTFGSSGRTLTSATTRDSGASGIVLDSLGRITVGGYGYEADTTDFALARYSSTGVLDGTFGTGGIVKTAVGTGDEYVAASGLALDSANRLVAGGWTKTGSGWHFGLARYNTNGTLDVSFGSFGTVVTAISPTEDGAEGFTIDDQDRIIQVGNSLIGGRQNLAVARFLPSGARDTSFGINGIVTTTLGPGDSFFIGVTIDNNGDIVTSGRNLNAGTGSVDFAVARLRSESFTYTPSVTTQIFTEDASPLAVDSGLTLTNSTTANLFGATVQIGYYIRDEDALNFTLQGGITASFDDLTGTLTFTGTSSVSNYQAVLRSLKYDNTSENPTVNDRTITITVDDGAPYHNLATASYLVHVVAQNDAPTLSADGVLSAIIQGNTNALGQTVTSLFAGFFVDPDPAATLQGIAISGNTANAGTEGVWQYSTNNGGTWFPVGTVTNAAALLLAANTRLRFVPVLSFTGSPAPLTLRAVDDTFSGSFTVGAVRQTLDTATNGGTTPLAAATTLLQTTVFPAGTGGNNAPLLNNVPTSVNLNELQTLSFTALGSDVDAGAVLTYSLVSAPATASIDPDTGVFSWTTTEADGPNTFVFTVQVSDGLAVTEKSVTVILSEVNAAPVLADVPATVNLTRGATLAFTATGTDSDLVGGLPNTLTFSLVDAPTGASIDPDTGAFTWTPSDTLPNGTYTFKVRLADDGVPSQVVTQNVVVTFATSLLDNGTLVIGGTTGKDTVSVTPAKDPTKVVVKWSKLTLGEYNLAAITGNIVIHTRAGADKITLSPKVLRSALIDSGADNDVVTGGSGNDTILGGSGNDKLSGGKGDNVLVGGAGNDVLTGNAGRDVLIGGAGKDTISGAAGDDLLIAGSTIYDTDISGLTNIAAEWNSSATYAERIAHLMGTPGGANGDARVVSANVTDDDTQDIMKGSTGQDWFVGQFVTGTLDKLDLKPDEQTLTI